MQFRAYRMLRPFIVGATLVLLFYFLFLRKTSFRRSARWEPLASVRFIPQNAEAIDAGPGNLPFSKIPKIIHQTWKSGDIPELMKPWVSSWMEKNPDWEYWLWTDEDIRDFISIKYPQFLSLYDRYPMHGYRVDAFRYFALYEYGGLYIDIDVECLRPLNTIMESHDCIISQEPIEHAHFLSPLGIPLLSNAIMACRPGHPFFELLVNQLPGYAGTFQWSNIFQATGPFMLTEIYRGYQTKGLLNKDIPYLGTPEQFQPVADISNVYHMREMCTYAQEKTMSKEYLARQEELCVKVATDPFDDVPPKESYTTHHWTHTWAGRRHDRWGVFNNDRTFTITDIHHLSLHRKKRLK